MAFCIKDVHWSVETSWGGFLFSLYTLVATGMFSFVLFLISIFKI